MPKFLITSYLLLITLVTATAQNGRMYDDQKYTQYKDPAWYDAPLLWVALAVVLGVIIFLRYRKMQRK